MWGKRSVQTNDSKKGWNVRSILRKNICEKDYSFVYSASITSSSLLFEEESFEDAFSEFAL